MTQPFPAPLTGHAAVFRRIARNLLRAATDTCNNKRARASAYPRTVLVYTIRTPSPDGQHGLFRLMLSVFFVSETGNPTFRHTAGARALRLVLKHAD